jgi:hypothetical protein
MRRRGKCGLGKPPKEHQDTAASEQKSRRKRGQASGKLALMED